MIAPRKLFLASLAFMLVHLFLSIGSILPANIVQPRVRSMALAYTEPIFRQQWAMFAPDPPTYHIDLQFRRNGESTWISPGQDLQEFYWTSRYNSRGKQYQLNQHIGFFADRELGGGQQPSVLVDNTYLLNEDQLRLSYGYRMAVSYAERYFGLRDISHDAIALRIIRHHPPRIPSTQAMADTLYLPLCITQ